MAARSRAWLTRVASAGAGILIIGVALGNRAMTDQSGTKHRNFLVGLSDRVDRDEIRRLVGEDGDGEAAGDATPSDERETRQ